MKQEESFADLVEDLSRRLAGVCGLFPEDRKHIIFDAAVERVKSQFAAEFKQAKRNDFERLLRTQIATLNDRGCPEQIMAIFQNKNGAVVEIALKLWDEKYPTDTLETLAAQGIYLAIPVIPRSWRGPHDLMAMVRNDSKAGYTHLNPTAIFDMVDALQEPYYIYDVEDGRATLGKTPENAGSIIESQKRHRHTVAEDMALATHTNVLLHHFLWSTGSRCGSAVGVPCVCLVGGARPRLGWFGVGISGGHWGSASCGSR